MGVMINGTYHAEDPGPDTSSGGEFKRAEAKIRDWITPDGPFTPDADRYHLYVAWNCPWAHRALIAREMLNLKPAISVSYARPRRTDQGWVFDDTGEFSDPELGVSAIHQVYAYQSPGYTGRCTMPVLWDRETGQIVSNESADIIRMFGTFNNAPDLYPENLRPQIDAWNDRIYPTLNNGVYRAGFARTQDAYSTAVAEVFETLDAVEAQLQKTEFLAGDTLTEADIRLFPTLARFDVAYHYAFKCNIRRITDYPALWAYARNFYARPGIAETVRFDVYKNGYHSKSELRNPLGIIPAGPEIDWRI
ncbi:MAG: glutathione-dependent reductase [Boseongicola sp.]|nr:glutathione-dependent reductase [Boseongicola sp.]